VMVGQRKAVAIAVRNASGRRRWSKLVEWLRPCSGVLTSPSPPAEKATTSKDQAGQASALKQKRAGFRPGQHAQLVNIGGRS